ncbi:MAG: GNAT family N-acetyltransferase [Planctomycetes bacterium]|nr:GNAT family N-acetyltransferase [Planctomycetota bacterium]MBI3845497.1 GNAT family N-acetyltransferase [Planctomycetota bacterium]
MHRNSIDIRSVEATDREAIARIDEIITGRPRPEYWRTRLEMAALRPPWMSLVAETDGRVVGFLFGWVGESEFGMAAKTAWIDLVGVEPRYRGARVGQALVDRFLQSAGELRAIEKVATLLDLDQADVREFFLHLGFHRGPMVQLEKTVQ